MQENPFQDRKNCKNYGNRLNYTEIERKLCGEFTSRKSKFSTKFNIKVRKPHFKLRKALFKRDLERNYKSKNVLEIDIEKMKGLLKKQNKKDLKKIIRLKYLHMNL